MVPMRIIVSGGGTGGHVYPALTLIRALQKKMPAADFLYVGTPHGLEADIIPREGIPFQTVNIYGFERHLTPVNLVRAAVAMAGVAKALRLVRRFRPDVAVGTGGYACGPTLLAARLLGVPTLIQEQNVLPGITNRCLAKVVTRVAAGVKEAVRHFPSDKVVVTGNPIRREVMSARREEGLAAFGFDPAKKTVLVSGGSLGARTINQAMVGVLAHYAGQPGVQILHMTGQRDYEDTMERLRAAGVALEAAPNLRVLPYIYDMPQALACADLAVFRAGAIGIAELTARGVPAILVPYPYAAANHQEHNARAMAEAGAARMILDRELDSARLLAVLRDLLEAESLLQAMAKASRSLGRPQAADDIAAMILSMTEGGKQ